MRNVLVIISAMLIAVSCSDAEFAGTLGGSSNSNKSNNNANQNPNTLNPGNSFQPGDSHNVGGTDSIFANGQGGDNPDGSGLGGGNGQAKCSRASIIDFEDQTDNNIPISDQYLQSHGVTFSLSNGGAPMLSTVGMAPRRHQCAGGSGGKCNSETNEIRTESQAIAGQKFLGHRSTASSFLVISYATPVKAASGYIIDVDGREFFEISAFDANGNVIATDNSIDGRPHPKYWRDGQASLFKLESPDRTRSIVKIELKGRRPDGGAPISFDKLSPTDICE